MWTMIFLFVSFGDFDFPSCDDGEDSIDHNEPDDIGYKSSSSGTSFYNLWLMLIKFSQRLRMKMNQQALLWMTLILSMKYKQPEVKVQGRRRLCRVVVKDD
ncbi:hypothetical protein Tco_1181238 [Tanacetum coccineum]